jgi:hypothetical protein
MNNKLSDLIKYDHAQLYTLEGAATAIMMIILIVFIIKASPLTPLTSSTSHQQVEAQLETTGTDLLIVLDHVPEDEEYSALKQALKGWDGDATLGQFEPPVNLTYLSTIFNSVFLRYGTAYNLEVAFLNEDEEWETLPIFWNGRSSDNSVLVTKKVAIHNSDDISEELQSKIPDISDNSDFYNILDIKLTLWRM